MPNNVSPFDVIAQVGDVYIAATSQAFPDILTVLSPRNFPDVAGGGIQAAVTTGSMTGWTYLGYTDGGITLQNSQTIKEITVDQTTFPVKAARASQQTGVQLSLVELTLESFRHAFNEATITAGGGGTKESHIDLNMGPTVATARLLVRFPSPAPGSDGTWLAQFEFPTIYQGGNPQAKFVKGDKAVLALDFRTLGIGGTFGTLRVRDTA